MLPVSCWSSVDVINVRRNLGAMVIYFGMFLADLRNDSKVHIYIKNTLNLYYFKKVTLGRETKRNFFLKFYFLFSLKEVLFLIDNTF